jgi:hypothetical protein
LAISASSGDRLVIVRALGEINGHNGIAVVPVPPRERRRVYERQKGGKYFGRHDEPLARMVTAPGWADQG